MRRCVRGWSEGTFHRSPFHVDDYDIGFRQLCIINAAWLNRKNSLLPISNADVAKVEINQLELRQEEICFEALCLDAIVVAHGVAVRLSSQASKARSKMIINLVVTKIPFEIAQLSLCIDHD